MRHVTDGELHTYLDGALDFLTGDRGDEVRDHLAECPVCRERLQDEETVRTEARGVLGDPDLLDVALPTFEELRERAEAPGLKLDPARDESDSRIHYRGPLKGLPLAWAATVVLALGVGWMGSEIFRGVPPGLRPAPALIQGDQARGSEQEQAEAAETQNLSATIRQTPVESGVGPAPASADLDEVGENRVEALDAERVGESAEDVLVSAELEQAREAASPEAQVVTPPGVVSGDSTGAGGREIPVSTFGEALRARRVDEARLSVPDPDPALLPRQFLPGARGVFSPPIPDSLEASLAVPGLEVLSVEWEENVPGERALHIRQLLPMGDTLELRYLGMLLGSAPSLGDRAVGALKAVEGKPAAPLSPQVLEASLPPGWNQVVMDWGRGVLVARAPLPEAQLRALVKTIH